MTIPWKSRGVSNTNLFARTIFLYWDKVETHGLPDGYTVRAFNVTLDKLTVRDDEDAGALSGVSSPRSAASGTPQRLVQAKP